MKIAELKATVDIVDVVGKYVTLRPRGAEHIGLCPFHEDKKPSLSVNQKKQLFFCGPCGAKGDVVDFLVLYGRTIREAKDELQGISAAAASGTIEKRQAKESKIVTWTPTFPAPKPGQILHYKYGKPARVWEYRNTDGGLFGYVCRFELREGKEIIPLTYCISSDGRKEWRWQGFGTNRPLYCMPDLEQRRDATVLIVEGEKAADAAQALLPHVVVTCWQGGANAIDKTDWSVLKGRKVVLWPDNDKAQKYGDKHPKHGELKPFEEQPGNWAMLQIYARLKDFCPVVRWVRNAPELPDKWDVADAVWSPDETVSYIKANMCEVPDAGAGWVGLENKPEEPEPEPEPVDIPQSVPEARPPAEYENYFSFLGYEKESDTETVAFYIKEAKIVHKYRAGSLSSLSTLCNLAPLDFWQHTFPKRSGDKVDTIAALNWLIRSARASGVFSSSKLRGRGAWIDAGRIVLHAGENLIVDGKPVQLGRLATKYIYEAGENLNVRLPNPVPVNEANKLLQMCQLINWERPISGTLLAGWCVVAPICGALPWRPHIWITGGAGTGKTWAFQNIVRRMLGRVGVVVQGETSEAGVRQTLGIDALPVMFDEAEGEDRRAAERIAAVIGLMRAASAEDGGSIVKGSATGGVKNYRIRSCFAFASIALALKQQSDRTRVTVLSIIRNNDEDNRKDKWNKLQALHAATVNDDFCDALQSRTLSMLPTILANSKVFAAAAAAHLQDQRVGDQLGPLLAGAYSLSSNELVTFEFALKWVSERDWLEERALNESRDERRLLAYILDYVTAVDVDGGKVDRTIGELVQIASNNQLDARVTEDAANNRLKRLGMKYERGYFFVSNNSAQVAKLLKETAWSNNHNRILERVEGSIRTAPERFAGNVATSRTVAIPIQVITG